VHLGSENRSTGELWGRLGVALGGQRGGQGGQEGVGGGRRRPKKKNLSNKFKVMKLCGGFSLLLKRPQLMLNEFFDDIFSESTFFLGFVGCYIYENFGIFSDDSDDKKIDFTIKKILRKGVRKLGNLERDDSGISSEMPWVPGSQGPRTDKLKGPSQNLFSTTASAPGSQRSIVLHRGSG